MGLRCANAVMDTTQTSTKYQVSFFANYAWSKSADICSNFRLRRRKAWCCVGIQYIIVCLCEVGSLTWLPISCSFCLLFSISIQRSIDDPRLDLLYGLSPAIQIPLTCSANFAAFPCKQELFNGNTDRWEATQSFLLMSGTFRLFSPLSCLLFLSLN